MTKKDYERFAYEINHQIGNKGMTMKEACATIDLCSMVFQGDNPAFNRDKFTIACLEGKHIRQSIKV